jgi:hypothetical protein
LRGRGLATAELAAALATLTFIALAACDYARCTFATMAVATAARNGALYQCDPAFAATTPYTSLQDAVQADAGGLSPAPRGSSSPGTDDGGNKTVAVTVTYPFRCLVNYPGFTNPLTIRRTVTMPVAPGP